MSLDSFSEIDRRLKRIEAALGIVEKGAAPTSPALAGMAPSSPTPATSPRSDRIDTPIPKRAPGAPAPYRIPTAPPKRTAVDSGPTSGLFLGAIAAFCLILAAVLMIRLAIESGWLTPIRQVWITALFGSACVATGFFSLSRDRQYFSILPGIGIAVMNLAVYGATFVHHLIDPLTAYAAISAIALLCLALSVALSQDLYVIYAVIGTHLGTIFLGGTASTPETPLLVLVIWNLIFAELAVRSGSRRLISVVAYGGFATVYFVGHGSNVLPAAVTQTLLFAIYFWATLRYSKLHQTPLTEVEAWSLFPPLLVFYITEYAWLSRLLGEVTPYLFLGLAAIVWIAYTSVSRKIKAPLESGKLVYLFVAGTVLHAFFFQIVPDDAKPIVGLVLSGAILIGRDRFDFAGEHFGLQVLAILTGLGGFLMALYDAGNHDARFAILNGVAYGVGLLYYSLVESHRKTDTQIRDLSAVLAHLQWMTALYRAREFFGAESLSLVVTILWVAYAFAVFALGWTRHFAWLCRSCLFILTFCILKLMIYDVWNQPAMVRIISLAGLGLSLYAFGFLLRRVSTWAEP
jgi:hypothetical protein